ncbi:hypothetical protein ACK2RV_000525 [Yersinia enterocolitica]
MKSNREARRLLGIFTNDSRRISNRGWMVFSANYPHCWVHRKPSASQNRAKNWQKRRSASLRGGE